MPSDSGSRPVSGEILGGPLTASRRPADAVDAVYETVPGEAAASPQPKAAPVPHAGLSVLAGSAGEPALQRGGPAFWTAGLLAVLAAFWFSGGHALFRFEAPLAAFDAAPAFDVLELKSRVEWVNGRSVLLVDGAIQNTGMKPADAPGVVLNIESGTGETTRYALGLGRNVLEPGDTASFSSRLDAPGDGVRKVFVTFAEDK